MCKYAYIHVYVYVGRHTRVLMCVCMYLNAHITDTVVELVLLQLHENVIR